MRSGPRRRRSPAAPQAAKCPPCPTRLLAAHNLFGPRDPSRPWKTPVSLVGETPVVGYSAWRCLEMWKSTLRQPGEVTSLPIPGCAARTSATHSARRRRATKPRIWAENLVKPHCASEGAAIGACVRARRVRGVGRSGARRARSSLRELMPNLVNTLLRCHSTVRALRKSCAPISGFDKPSRASRAICSSCDVSSSRVSRAPLAYLLAGCEQLAAGALGERLHADRDEHVVGGPQLLTRVEARPCRRSHSP